MKRFWKKLPWWGKTLVVLLLIVLGIISLPILGGLLIISALVFALVKGLVSGEAFRSLPSGEEDEEGRDLHIYHHRDPNSGRRSSYPSGGFANRGLYQVNINRKGAEFIGGKMKKPRLW